MSTPKPYLNRTQVQALALKLQSEFGSSDRERLQKLIELIGDDGTLPYHLALQVIAPGKTPGLAQADLRAFRSRLAMACSDAKLGNLCLEVDSKKKSKSEERRLWFTGDDLAQEHLVAFARELVQEHYSNYQSRDYVEQSVAVSVSVDKPAADKPRFTVFISYVHEDSRDKTLLIERIDELRNDLPINITVWSDVEIIPGQRIDTQIKQQLQQAHIGWLLLSPHIMDSSYVLGVELPALIQANKLIPVGLSRGQFHTNDTFFNALNEKEGTLKEALQTKVFLLEGRKPAAFFDDCIDKDNRGEFAQKLLQATEKFLAQKQDDNISSSPVPPDHTAKWRIGNYPDPRYESEHFEPSDAKLRNQIRPEGLVDLLERRDKPEEDHVVALEYLYRWVKQVQEQSARLIAILGEYGTGKTFISIMLARLVNEERQQDSSIPLVLVVDLRYAPTHIDAQGVRKLPTLEQILAEELRRHEQKDLTADEVIAAAREGKAIIVFDGLDEKLVHLPPSDGALLFQEMLRLLTGFPQARAVFSCRTHYFRTLTDQNSFFIGHERKGPDAAAYQCLELLPFTESKIRAYLAKRLAATEVEQAMHWITRETSLADLAARPYTLSLIAEVLPQIEREVRAGKSIDSARLYQFIVDRWYQRDEGKHNLLRRHRDALMRQLAADLARSGKKSWNIAQLEDWLACWLSAAPGRRDCYPNMQQALFDQDLRTATFLVRVGESDFGFAHTSLQEFFLAGYVRDALIAGDSTALMLVINRETEDFLQQMLFNSDPGDQQAIANSLARALEAPFEPRRSLAALRLWQAMQQHGNVPLPQPDSVQLEGADLAGTRFTGLQLRNLNLRNADLRASEWRGNTLLGADFGGALLNQSRWAENRLQQADFAQTQLIGSFWVHNRLDQCSLENANSAAALWIDCGADKPLPPYTQSPMLKGHRDSVSAVAFAPDGRHFISGSDDNTVKLWNRKGQCLMTCSGHKSFVSAVAFAPDGGHFLSGSFDYTVKLWNRKGQCLMTCSGHKSPVTAVAFAPDGRHFLSGSGDNTVKLWNRKGQCLVTYSGHKSVVTAVAFAPDGGHFISGSGDNTVKLWDLKEQCLVTCSGHKSPVTAVAFAPDGEHFISGSEDNTVKLWNLKGQCLLTCSGHKSPVTAVAFAPNGKHFISGSWDNTAKLWNLNGQCLLTCSGHEGWISAVAFAPDGRHFISGSRDNTAKLWNLKGQCLLTCSGHKSPVTAVAFAPDGKRFISGSRDDTAKLWNLKGQCLVTCSGHERAVSAVAFVPDSRHFISGSWDNTVKLWNLKGQCLLTCSGHKSPVTAVAFAPNGKHFISGSWDKTAKLWNLKGQCLLTCSGHEGWISAVAFAPDGGHFISGSDDNTVKLWNRQGQCLLTCSGHESAISAVAFAPDGEHFISGSQDNTVKLWNLKGQCLVTCSGHERVVPTVAFAPDGEHFLSGSWDNTVKLWNRQGQCLLTCSGHGDRVNAVAFAPDGEHFISGSSDNTVKLWNRQGECLKTYWHLPHNETAVSAPDKDGIDRLVRLSTFAAHYLVCDSPQHQPCVPDVALLD